MTDAKTAQPRNDVIIDWVSFTLPWATYGSDIDAADQIVQVAMRDFESITQGWQSATPFSRRPYTYRIAGDYCNLYYNPNPNVQHVLIECSGQQCQKMRDDNVFEHIMLQAYTDAINITRCDVAVDFECDTDPAEFAATAGERWTNRGSHVSETGKTEYIGSMKSDRYCRVYRYNEPHERAHLLRVEMVFRKGYAGNVLYEYLMDMPPQEYAGMVGKPWAFTHPHWQFMSERRLIGNRTDTKRSSTTRWIHKAVIPAIRKLRLALGDDHPIFDAIRTALPPSRSDGPPSVL